MVAISTYIDRRVISGLLLCAGIVGCREQTHRVDKFAPDDIASYASLVETRRSAHRELRAELERLDMEKATPEAMSRPEDPALLPVGSHPTRDSRLRATRMLVELLPSAKRREWMDQINSEFPRAALRPDPANHAAYAELARRWAAPLAEAESLLARPDFGLYIPLDQGLLADLTCVDVVRTIVRQECLLTAVGTLEEDLAAALLHWDLAGRWLLELAALPHAVSRAAAARGRIEWLRTGQSVLHAPLASPDTYETVHRILSQHLSQWPPDANALRGDRAVGLHTYELLRAGYWMSLLTLRELQELRRRKEVEPFVLHLATHLDDDEYFYLSAMRRMIAIADQPYYERRKEFDSIRQEWEALRPTPRYPWFAAEYLLPDVFAVQRWQAIDYQLATALEAAIEAALTEPPVEERVDTFTGEPWKWLQDELATVLTNVYWPIDESPISIPTLRSGRRPSDR